MEIIKNKKELKEFNELNNLLNNLPKNDRIKLCSKLTNIFISEHLYFNEWKNIKINNKIFECVIEIIKKYETNELQLNGYGCLLLNRIIIYSNYHLNSENCENNNNTTLTTNNNNNTTNNNNNNNTDNNNVIELILRILLEHSIYLVCIEILWIEMKRDSNIFLKLCNIIIKIVDELPHPLLSENFACFMNFIANYLSKNWNFHTVHLALHALTSLAPIVEVSNFKVNYFFNNILQVCLKFHQEYQDLEPSKFSSSLPHPLLSLFSFLKEICPLHPESISMISSSGFFHIAIDYLLTPPLSRKISYYSFNYDLSFSISFYWMLVNSYSSTIY